MFSPLQEANQEPRVYFDYLGWFMINYSLTEAIIINSIVFTAALSLIVISLKFMADKLGKSKLKKSNKFICKCPPSPQKNHWSACFVNS